MADILLGKGEQPVSLRLDRANRHGLIAGATGTGKTVTLQVLAEGFAAQVVRLEKDKRIRLLFEIFGRASEMTEKLANVALLS